MFLIIYPIHFCLLIVTTNQLLLVKFGKQRLPVKKTNLQLTLNLLLLIFKLLGFFLLLLVFQ